MRYIAGADTGNLLARAVLITPAPALDAILGVGSLYDGRAKTITKFGSLVADSKVTIDLALFAGAFETWGGGAPAGWTKTTSGTGTVVETVVGAEVRSGSAAKGNKGSGTAQLSRTITVRVGERLTLDVWLRIAAAGQSKVQIYDVLTHKYLTSGGAWQTGATYCASEVASTNYVNTVRTFTVEDWQAHQANTTQLRILWEDTGAGGGSDFAFVDDLYVYPTWNFCSIHGHNIDAGTAVELRSDTAAFAGAGTLEATLTNRVPSFHAYLSAPVGKRWARVTLVGTNSAIPYLGELVIGYAETAARKIKDGWEVREMESQVRNVSPVGEVFALNRTQFTRRAIRPTFKALSDAQWREGRDDIFRRCRGGANPLVIVPMDDEDVVLLGRIDDTIAAQRAFRTSGGQLLEYDLPVAESPFNSLT